MPRIYLDNAATSFPKPRSVYDAVDHYQRDNGAPVGRGGYVEAIEIARTVSEVRLGIAKMLGDHDARRIIFTSGGTESLNLAISGLLNPGDHVVTTDAEHNSVLRPLRWLAQHRNIRVTHVPCDQQGRVHLDELTSAVTKETRLVALTHASNVTGAVNDVEAVSLKLAKLRRGALGGPYLLVDAAQSLGCIPLDAKGAGVDLVAAPAHKGLMGPLGLGVLYLSERAAEVLKPIMQGGTGSDSESDYQPTELPSRLESGNQNAPAIVGLAAALAWRTTPEAAKLLPLARHLAGELAGGLAEIEGARVITGLPHASAAVVSLHVPLVDPAIVGAILDNEFGIRVRTGYHCAARIHKALGTDDGGVVRFSPGPFSTSLEIETTIAAVKEIIANVRG